MKKLCLTLFFILPFTVFGIGDVMPLEGYLVFGYSGAIRELNLKTLEVSVLHGSIGEPFNYESISKIDEQRFLFADRYSDNRKEFKNSIKEFDRKSKTVRFVRSGTYPTYIPEHRKFFFFESTTKTGPQLFLADLDRPNEGVRRISVKEGKFTNPHQIIQVSPDEVVFLVRDDGKSPPYLYNLVSDTLTPLPFKRLCRPEIWRSATRQLLCHEDWDKGFYLADLRGEKIERLDFAKAVGPILYIPKHDVLIVNLPRIGSRGGETNDIWVYNFKTQQNSRVLKDVSIGIGSAAWFE